MQKDMEYGYGVVEIIEFFVEANTGGEIDPLDPSCIVVTDSGVLQPPFHYVSSITLV